MPRTYRYRCPECRKVKVAGRPVLWCDDCGAELKPLRGGSWRRVKRDR